MSGLLKFIKFVFFKLRVSKISRRNSQKQQEKRCDGSFPPPRLVIGFEQKRKLPFANWRFESKIKLFFIFFSLGKFPKNIFISPFSSVLFVSFKNEDFPRFPLFFVPLLPKIFRKVKM